MEKLDIENNFKYLLTFHLKNKYKITTEINTNKLIETENRITQAIDKFHNKSWIKKARSTIKLFGDKDIIIPISKIVIFTIEKIDE